jgi:hypothetical protein
MTEPLAGNTGGPGWHRLGLAARLRIQAEASIEQPSLARRCASTEPLKEDQT